MKGVAGYTAPAPPPPPGPSLCPTHLKLLEQMLSATTGGFLVYALELSRSCRKTNQTLVGDLHP